MKKLIRRLSRIKTRVFIMPTKMGGYFNGLIFLMFLLSSGYGNNLLLIFTILLFALNLLWLIQTHFHLYRLRLDTVRILSGHVGEQIGVSIEWKALPKGPWAWKCTLETLDESFPLELISSDNERVDSVHYAPHRGEFHWRYLRVDTDRPFGLYRAWIFFKVDIHSLAYPKLLSQINIKLEGRDSEGETAMDRPGIEGFRGMAAYQDGESRRINWKYYARSGELMIKEGEELKAPALEIKLQIPNDNKLKEHYLSEVATQLVECHRRQIPFSLISPGVNLVSGHHRSHLSDCLKVLTLC